MIYLYWYLGIGVAVLAVVFGAHRLMKNDESEWFRDILDALNPDRKKLLHRILNNLVVPVLAAVAVVVVWPAALYMKGKEIFGTKSDFAPDEEQQFAVERGHLQERLTVAQIEAREVVADPLGAVPTLPFGHLNAAWRTFIANSDASDEVWSFTAPWQTTRGRREIRAGYVVVRGGDPAAHFLTMLKEIEDEQKIDQGSAAPVAGAEAKASDGSLSWLRKQAD